MEQTPKEHLKSAQVVLNELGDESLASQILNNTVTNTPPKKTRVLFKFIAFVLWITTMFIARYTTISDELTSGESALSSLLGISTLGLILVLISGSTIATYKGPVWPLAGRFGQHITKPTPVFILKGFGWFLLLLILSIFSITAIFE